MGVVCACVPPSLPLPLLWEQPKTIYTRILQGLVHEAARPPHSQLLLLTHSPCRVPYRTQVRGVAEAAAAQSICWARWQPTACGTLQHSMQHHATAQPLSWFMYCLRGHVPEHHSLNDTALAPHSRQQSWRTSTASMHNTALTKTQTAT
jgi:hypothetical protein